MGRAVNPLALPTLVRIHPSPPKSRDPSLVARCSKTGKKSVKRKMQKDDVKFKIKFKESKISFKF